PLWRKAPVTLAWHRSALAAVTVAGLLVALASSSAPFVTTASASSALKSNLQDLAPLATGLQLHWYGEITGSQSAQTRAADRRAAAFRSLSKRLGLEPPVLT